METDTNKKDEKKEVIKLIVYGILLLFFGALLYSTVYTIPAGYRGVVLTFGKPSVVATGEGLNFKIPFVQSVVKMDTRTQKYEASLTAASADLQDVNTKIAINYHLSPESVPELYRTIGVNYADKIIYPLEQESNKAATAQFNAVELITKREAVRENMKTTLRDKLASRGIIIEDISIVDFAFSASFSQAIENKVTQEQNALAAKNKLEQIKYEAQQTVTKATAEAEALRLKKQSITPELVQLSQIEVQSKALDVQKEAIAKWNGVMPQVTGGATPFISLGTLPISEIKSTEK